MAKGKTLTDQTVYNTYVSKLHQDMTVYDVKIVNGVKFGRVNYGVSRRATIVVRWSDIERRWIDD